MEHRDTRTDNAPFADGSAIERARRALTPRRLEEIRRRLHEGTYDDPTVIDAVARRLIDSGDL